MPGVFWAWRTMSCKGLQVDPRGRIERDHVPWQLW